MKNYGTKSPMQNKEFKENLKEIFKSKYGVENPSQVPEVAEPPSVPESATIEVPQIVWSIPALIVAGCAIVINTWSETATHGPIGSFDVNVKVTLPALISAALGV